MNSKAFYFLALASIATAIATAQVAPRVQWYAIHQALDEAGNSLNLGEPLQKIDLMGGWSCSVAPTSKQLPLYEAREVTCQSGEKKIAFSVQCEAKQMKDHTQIRFKDASGKSLDFIEVGCELTE